MQVLKIKKDDTVLTLTSGGCNSLNLLLHGAGHVVSVDCNPAQSALLELKATGIRRGSYSISYTLRILLELIAHEKIDGPPAESQSTDNPLQLLYLLLSCKAPTAHRAYIACRQLQYNDFWKMFGEGKHTGIEKIYEAKLAPFLTQTSLRFWNSRLWYFIQGLYYQGGMVRLYALSWRLSSSCRCLKAMQA